MTEAAQNDTPAFSPEVIAEVFGAAEEAAETAGTEPVAETPAAPESETPKGKSNAERIAAALKAEKRAEVARRDAELRKRDQDSREGDLTKRATEVDLFEKDPAAYIAKKGWDQSQVAAFLDKLAGNVQPEAITDKKLTEQDQRIKDLEAKLAAKEAAEVATQHQQAQVEAGKAFVGHIAGAVEKYPSLTEVYANDDEVVAAGFAVLTQVVGTNRETGQPVTRVQAFMARHGRPPTDEELAEHLDSIAKAKIEARSKASWRTGNAATTRASQAASGESKEVPPVTGTSPRTLSRADTSTRAAAPRKTEWSQEQADEESLKILSQAMRTR